MTDGQGYDYVIVGAGTAGCVLASRLSADLSARVALVEAGGESVDPTIHDPLAWPALQGSAVDWAFATAPQAGTARRIHAWPRGRVVGGSSCINAMAHVRGHPDDFDTWAAVGCTGWGFSDLMPYALKSEHSPHGPSPWHGHGGPLHLIQPKHPHTIAEAYMAAGQERGLTPIGDHNGPTMAGPTLNTLTIKDGRRQTIADAYLDPAVRARPNLAILTGRTVQRISISAGGRCDGIVLAAATGEVRLHAETAVILAAGAIGSPVLLLRSGIGPADELRALGIACVQPLDGVGRNLHDHLLAGGNVYRARQPVPPSRYQHSESLTYIAGDAAADVAPELVVACVVAPVVTDAFAAPDPGTVFTLMFGFTHPESRGALRLVSAEPGVPPRIDPNYLQAPEDKRRHLQALDWARALGGSKALADWRAEELLPAPEDLSTNAAKLAFVQRAAYTHHHPVGTCRMGQGEDAVVGPDLAIRGIEGLFVADASVIPTITTGPVSAAIVALAERASDLIAGRPVLPPADPREQADQASESLR